MSGTNPVWTYVPPNNTTQTGGTYKGNIDGAFSVGQRFTDAFAPHELDPTPNMTVVVDAGAIYDQPSETLTEVAQQTTGTFTAPVGNPRIDRIVRSLTTGAISVVTGTPAASPTPPAIPSGNVPVAQVLLQTTSTAITNAMITDERPPASTAAGTVTGLTSTDLAVSGSPTITANLQVSANTAGLYAYAQSEFGGL
jgi:hypothetical protein